MPAFQRTLVQFRIGESQADDNETGPVRLFRLERESIKQTRRSTRHAWRDDTPAADWYTRETWDNITRTQLAQLIATAAEWLSYPVEDE